jgi:type IV pilus assembly protein PilY1
MTRTHRIHLTPTLAALAFSLLVSAPVLGMGVVATSPPLDASGDDVFLISTSTSPNVILLMDNSDTMNSIEWHEDFDPEADPATYGCTAAETGYDNSLVYTFTSDSTPTHTCGGTPRTRKIYGPTNPTYWSGRYLNWYFGLDSVTDATVLNEIATEKANIEGCTAAGGGKFFDEKYRRTRFEASKQVLIDLLCLAESKGVRFGLANYRDVADAALEDPNGGYVLSDLGRSNPNHAAELEAEITLANTVAESPLAEALFQIYSFWMPRDATYTPSSDQNGDATFTDFPLYQYDKFGNWTSNTNLWMEDAIEFSCEKAFVVIVTDGQPSYDDFGAQLAPDPASTGTGFSDYADLIGDYNADGEVEDPGVANRHTWYLDDIAKYMYENDFRPDLADDQTIDTYTIGFALDSTSDDFLEKTALMGNGLFFSVKNGDELAFALIEALNDIIEKSASFTAATVPSARTSDGVAFFQSFFFPRASAAFWEGHIRAWTITGDGDIEDKNGNCALDDPTVGECNSGPFKSDAVYFWDAAEEVPAPDSRTLYVSKSSPTKGAIPPSFDHSLTAADLNIDPFAAAPDPAPNSALYTVFGTASLNEEGLADEVVSYTRGCFFGTGPTTNVAPVTACLPRPVRLADIFHSNPVVVRRPGIANNDPSYIAFKNYYSDRTRVLYAGTNGGFLEGIHAGSFNSGTGKYILTDGGAEVFGFMPWEARTKIKGLRIEGATQRTHYVDGNMNASDAWIHSSATDASKAAEEWHTVLVGGLREGGHHYFALDVTDPDTRAFGVNSSSPIPYPAYLWEFPDEVDTASDLDWMGETWGKPILTKIKVEVVNDDNGGAGYERAVAIVTGGYDPLSDPNPDTLTGVTSSYDAALGKAGRSLWVIDLKTGGVIAEKTFDAAAADDADQMEYSFVGTPAIFDLNFDGFADVVYVGDMGGRLFKWVITNRAEDRVNDGSGVRTQPSWTFKQVFQADVANFSGDDYYKNFMFPPAATYKNGQFWLAFGSGERRNLKYLGDASEDENNRFYVLHDPDPLELSGTIPLLDESDLTDITGVEDGSASFTNYGYFFKVADGEKFVTNVEIFAGHVIAASFTPSPPGTDPCVTRGNGTLYVFDLANGEGYFSDGGGNPIRGLDIGAGLPTDPKVSVGVGGKNNRVIIEKSGTDLESIEESDISTTGGVIYWRER